jgi:hypothetical protein
VRLALDPVAVAVHDEDLVGEGDVVSDDDLLDRDDGGPAVDEHAVAHADPTTTTDHRLAVSGPDLEALAHLEVRGVHVGVAEHDGLGPHGPDPTQRPLGPRPHAVLSGVPVHDDSTVFPVHAARRYVPAR